MKKFWNYIKSLFDFKYNILVARSDKYMPVEIKTVSKSDLNKMGCTRTWTREPIYDIEHDKYLLIDTYDVDFIKGHKYLIKNLHDCTMRIATCISVDKIGTFPPLFDGSETVGIGYMVIGKVV